jgi:NADH:ubiquinone oxidoreductase subunit 5 (subunit L)/multisubunit Na+/H+ antiporter MnhA subunit
MDARTEVPKGEEQKNPLKDKAQGIFGFGLSHNNHLDLLNIVVLACIGIIIKLFFSENYSRLGNMGPASSTIWGYGLTAIALSIMIFMGVYSSNRIFQVEKQNNSKNANFLGIILLNTLPIVLTLFVIIYTIFLNFSYFTRINTDKVTRDYHTYSFMSSFLIIVQIILISAYLFNNISNSNKETIKSEISNKIELSKNITYVLCVVNFIFLLMIHISLAFFSTDEIVLK